MDAKTALKLATETKDYWSDIYKAMKADVRFSIGKDHYHGKNEQQCREQGLLVVPILPQFIHQVVNDMRMNTPSINVLPGEDENSDIETAKIFKGLIRNIEYKSKADEVYDTAGEYAVRGGLGFAYVDHDYISEDSFLQELKLRRCHNPGATYLDTAYTECDGSDAEYGFILEPIKKKAFEERWPDKKFVSFDDAPPDTNLEEINICQFFIKKYTEITKQMSADGEMVDYEKDDNEEADKKKTKRKLRKVTIERYYFSGSEELEKTTFPGIYIPIVPFHGEEVWDDGKRNLLSLIRQAKDAQVRVNKWATKESQLLDMAPVSPVQAPVGSVDDFMSEWGDPADVMVMRYKQYDSKGQPLNKPERLPPPPIPTGFVNAMQEATEHVKQAMGLYNASLGAKSNETSGVAIDARKVEGEVATFHFADNRNLSIQHIGRILVCAIPEIYDTDRIIQIIGDEEEPKMVGINGAHLQDGQKQEHDLRKGKYEVRVTTGASYTTKRQEAAALLSDLITKTPALMGVMGDLLFKNMDIAGADAIAARVKKTIPKELLADEDAEKGVQAPDPEKEEMAQVIEGLHGELQKVEAALNDKEGEQALKNDELAVKRQELEVKMEEVRVKGVEAQAKLAAAQNQPTPLQEDNTAENYFKEREMRLKEMEFELKTQMALLDVIRESSPKEQAEKPNAETPNPEQEQREMEMDTAKMAQLSGIQQTLEKLITAIQQPIEVVRDENGVVVGAQ